MSAIVMNVGGIGRTVPFLVAVYCVVGVCELMNSTINKVSIRYFLAILKFTPLYLNNIIILFEQQYDQVYNSSSCRVLQHCL